MRVLTTLNHQEPDRVPYDLASTQITGIQVGAYRELRAALGLSPVDVQIYDHIQQLALPDADVLQRLRVDTRGLYPLNSHNWNVTPTDGGDVWIYRDEWGITHHMLRPEENYYSIHQVPLPDLSVSVDDIKQLKWPDMGDPRRIAGLRERALAYRAEGYAVVIKELAPHTKQFFHSDGNLRPLLPDFIELGVDILNPVQFTATGMALAELKREFGRDFVFWGGGVNTTEVLAFGTPQQVRDDVRRNIDIMAPGGGFVFNTIHNIINDVPPQNVIAMWEALQEYGVYD